MSESEESLIDWGVVKGLEELDDGEGIVLKEFYQIFIETVEQSLMQLSKNSRLENLPEVAKIAHSLKSSFGNIGATQCQLLSVALEKCAVDGDLKTSKEKTSQIKAGYTKARAVLEPYINKSN